MEKKNGGISDCWMQISYLIGQSKPKIWKEPQLNNQKNLERKNSKTVIISMAW